MKLPKLEDIANIYRGYTVNSSNITPDSNAGQEAYILNFADIQENKLNYGEKIFLKNNNFKNNKFEKYMTLPRDILIPTTFTSNLEIKCIAEYLLEMKNNKEDIPLILYSQNIVVIRLKDYEPYDPISLATVLNSDEIKTKITSEMYSNKTNTRGIKIKEFRKMELPVLTEDLKSAIEKYKEEKEKLLKQQKAVSIAEIDVNNLIKNIMS